eukprot:scaffold42275_cov34-Phaeocystis_antarctica.AAC.2
MQTYTRLRRWRRIQRRGWQGCDDGGGDSGEGGRGGGDGGVGGGEGGGGEDGEGGDEGGGAAARRRRASSSRALTNGPSDSVALLGLRTHDGAGAQAPLLLGGVRNFANAGTALLLMARMLLAKHWRWRVEGRQHKVVLLVALDSA